MFEYEFEKIVGFSGEHRGWICTRWEILPSGARVYAGRAHVTVKKRAAEAFND